MSTWPLRHVLKQPRHSFGQENAPSGVLAGIAPHRNQPRSSLGQEGHRAGTEEPDPATNVLKSDLTLGYVVVKMAHRGAVPGAEVQQCRRGREQFRRVSLVRSMPANFEREGPGMMLGSENLRRIRRKRPPRGRRFRSNVRRSRRTVDDSCRNPRWRQFLPPPMRSTPQRRDGGCL